MSAIIATTSWPDAVEAIGGFALIGFILWLAGR